MSVPSWLNKGTAPTAPPMGEQAWAKTKSRQLGAIAAKMAELVVEPGDAADQARAFAILGREAMDDHPRHGRNWWAKHEGEMRAMVEPFLNPEPVLQGAALLACVASVFGPSKPARTHLDEYYGPGHRGAVRR